MFDITCGLAHRFSLTKLVDVDKEVHPYLSILMVAILAWVGATLVMLEGTQIMTMTREAFDNMFLKGAGHDYYNYRLVSK